MSSVTLQENTRVRKFYPGVNVRIIAPFLLAIIAIAAIGIFIITNLVAGSIQERFSNQLLDSANAAANTIVDIERAQVAALRAMAFTEGVAGAILTGAADDLDEWLRPLALNNQLDELLVYNTDGQPVLHLRRVTADFEVNFITPAPYDDFYTWAGVNRVLNGDADALGDKFVDLVNTATQPTFFFHAPVITEGRVIVGGIALGLRADTLARRVSEQALSSVMFTTAAGETLSSTFRTAQTNEALFAENHPDVLYETVQQQTPIQDVELGGLPYQVLHAPFQLRSQQIGVLTVGLPSNYIVERSSTSRDVFGVLFGGFFVVVGVLGLIVARTITHPIERLVNTTRAIREGDLSRRVELAIPDELGELGTSFDEMTDQLVSTNEEIRTLYHRQVQETAQRQAVLTSISDAVIMQDTHGNMVLYNRTAATLMQSLQKQREQREDFLMLCRHPHLLAAEPQMATFAERHFSVLATPVQTDTDELIGYVIVLRDITAIIKAEALKDELVLQMSHELRTPMSAVRGFVDLVKMIDGNNLSQQSTEFIDKARIHLTTLERMVNQVIDVSAMISNRFTTEPIPTNLADVLADTYDHWYTVMQGRDHLLSLWLSHDEMWIECDPLHIEDALSHLLQNAYDYTLPGGLIAIHAEQTAHAVMISIIDNGVGIHADEHDQVFERLYRGRSAAAGATDARGLGVGLYMCRQIVEAHGGTITLESAPDEGTAITIHLPLKVS